MYIITGGAGFIGSVTAAALEAGPGEKSPTVIVDSFGSSSKWQNVVRRRARDIIHPSKLPALLEKHQADIKAVIHFGATSSTTENNMDFLLENNVFAATRLFDWCANHNKKFVFASSAAVYGNGAYGFSDDERLSYINKLRPLHPQGWSKHLVDKYMVQANKKPPSWLSLRFFNVYGPNEYHKGRMASVASHVFQEAKKGGPVRLFKSHVKEYKDGEQKRDFVYVKDVARLVVWLLQQDDISGIFNVGTGRARSFDDLAHVVCKAIKERVDIEYINIPPEVRPNYQYFTEADMSKMWQYVENSNTRPFEFTSLEDGIKDYVENYLIKDDPYL